MKRQSGLIVPLFSLVSSRGWGIGEFADLPVFARWMAEAGQSLLQLLPLGEMTPGERSPYSAMTAMALDPIYICLPQLDDFVALGGEAALEAADRAALEFVRGSLRVRYGEIRDLKSRWLRRSWDRFRTDEIAQASDRARRFDAFRASESWWLDEYTLFRAVHARYDEQPWPDWPPPLARSEEPALSQARVALSDEIEYRAFVQWVAAEQWATARHLALPVRIFGDLPFMISGDSPDVWARQGEFRFDATVGVPPDAFSETGQNWGLPPWRWDVMATTDFSWMRRRALRYAALYDGFRIDHLVGLYRTYLRPLDEATPAFFSPADEATQIELGETLVGIAIETGAEIIAEDLGVIPSYVRDSMTRLGLPGLRVLRWERNWDEPGQPLVDPREFPALSVATTGTHDIEPLAATEEGQTEDQRAAALQALVSAGSQLTLIPLQDVFGWTDRVNTPAVVDEMNWTWRVPWPVDRWLNLREPFDRARTLCEWTRAAGRIE